MCGERPKEELGRKGQGRTGHRGSQCRTWLLIQDAAYYQGPDPCEGHSCFLLCCVPFRKAVSQRISYDYCVFFADSSARYRISVPQQLHNNMNLPPQISNYQVRWLISGSWHSGHAYILYGFECARRSQSNTSPTRGMTSVYSVCCYRNCNNLSIGRSW